MQIRALPVEEGMFFDFQKYVQVAVRSAMSAGLAFTGQPEAGPFIHARRNIDFQFLVNLPVSVAAAFGARVPDDLPLAAAGAAGAANRKEALLVEYLAAPMARGARSGTAARFRTRTLAPVARLHA